ncbi:hypothetical protein SDRG_11376 [Saprolegnia diclina VS20]|uniref:Ferric reductase NAD binding domain-containing protein n=1 Tax=Saprolegnia diclina (strain VS20) TaxID=1156394 RepID=T0QBI9_SAPDV|nr:hypothetical protein SDRG_11376 [Saprolegnia diclina VS20]EQC30895.1 hypothetical protein SDRG_11376 [Saprolegnia diclina VS20]|eukprot:XP_008615633.1 hypothetical protein SDRG_11376 [Saprolegnia diclina VS20]
MQLRSRNEAARGILATYRDAFSPEINAFVQRYEALVASSHAARQQALAPAQAWCTMLLHLLTDYVLLQADSGRADMRVSVLQVLQEGWDVLEDAISRLKHDTWTLEHAKTTLLSELSACLCADMADASALQTTHFKDILEDASQLRVLRSADDPTRRLVPKQALAGPWGLVVTIGPFSATSVRALATQIRSQVTSALQMHAKSVLHAALLDVNAMSNVLDGYIYARRRDGSALSSLKARVAETILDISCTNDGTSRSFEALEKLLYLCTELLDAWASIVRVIPRHGVVAPGLHPASFNTLAFVAGGIGVTPLLGVLVDAVHATPAKATHFVWHVRDMRLLHKFESIPDDVVAKAPRWQVHYHVTQPASEAIDVLAETTTTVLDLHPVPTPPRPMTTVSKSREVAVVLLSFLCSGGLLLLVQYGNKLQARNAALWQLQRCVEFCVVVLGAYASYMAVVPRSLRNTFAADYNVQHGRADWDTFLQH